MNIFRVYGDGIAVADFSAAETTIIGRVMLEISAIACGSKGKSTELHDRTVRMFTSRL